MKYNYNDGIYHFCKDYGSYTFSMTLEKISMAGSK